MTCYRCHTHLSKRKDPRHSNQQISGLIDHIRSPIVSRSHSRQTQPDARERNLVDKRQVDDPFRSEYVLEDHTGVAVAKEVVLKYRVN